MRKNKFLHLRLLNLYQLLTILTIQNTFVEICHNVIKLVDGLQRIRQTYTILVKSSKHCYLSVLL